MSRTETHTASDIEAVRDLVAGPLFELLGADDVDLAFRRLNMNIVKPCAVRSLSSQVEKPMMQLETALAAVSESLKGASLPTVPAEWSGLQLSDVIPASLSAEDRE
jgi:hypothetical protein